MKNLFHTLIVAFMMLNIAPVFSVTPETIKKLEEEAKVRYFSSIPREIKTMILSMTADGATEDDIIQEIKKMRLVSKDYKNTIDTLIGNGKLIQYIAIKFREQRPDQGAMFSDHISSIAKKLSGIPATQEWLKRQQKTVLLENQGFKAILNPSKDNLNQVEQMISQGIINVNMLSMWGWTPLMQAVQMINPANHAQSAEFITFLLNHGADTNLTAEWNNNTPVMIAARKLEIDILRQLLKAGANPNTKYAYDWFTPLASAVYGLWNANDNNRKLIIETVKILLEAGALPNIKNKKGLTALDHALEFNAPREIIYLLQQYGAKRGSELP